MVALPSADERQQRRPGGRFQPFPGWALDVGVGCLVVCAFVIFITEPLPVDPMIYLEAAQDPFASELNHWTARLLVLAPASVVSFLFGFSEVSLYAIPLLFGFILGMATSALGRLVFSPAVGAAAALIAASGPIILPYGTQLLPDIGAAALLTASLALLYRASEKNDPRSHRNSVLAGLFFGCAYLVRETSLIFAPAVLVAAWILNVRDKRLALIVLGALVAPALEIPAGWLLWSEPFARVEAVLGHGQPIADVRPRDVNSVEAQATYVDSLEIFISYMWRSVYGRVVLLGSAAFAVIAAVTRNRRYVALAAWILLAWLSFAAIGTVGFTGRLIIRLLLERYWAFMMSALAIAAVGAFAFVLERVARRFGHQSPLKALVFLSAAGAVVLGVVASFDARGDWFMRFGNDGYWQLRSSLTSTPPGAHLYVTREFTNLTRLYTVDPLGQPTANIQIGLSAGDPEFVLISAEDVKSDSLASDGFRIPISDAYRLFAAEQRHPSWVLLTTLTDQASQAESLLYIRADGVEWRGKRVANGKWHEPISISGEVVSIQSDEQLIVFDSSAQYGRRNSTSPVSPGALVELRAPLLSVEGTIQVVCQFHNVSGQEDRTDVRALSVLQGDDSGGQLTAFCRAPIGKGQHIVRPVLVVSGPGTLQIEDGRLLVHG